MYQNQNGISKAKIQVQNFLLNQVPAAHSATPALIALTTATFSRPSAHAPAAMVAKPARRQAAAKAQLAYHSQDAPPAVIFV